MLKRVFVAGWALMLTSGALRAEEALLVDSRVPDTVGAMLEAQSFKRWSPDPARFNTPLFRQALGFYASGKMEAADSLARQQTDPGARAALEWAAIRSGRATLGFDRLNAFLVANPEFPMRDWIRRRAESALFDERQSGADARVFFENYTPDTAAGKIVLATLKRDDGDLKQAVALVRGAWRDNTVSPGIERAILKSFPDIISESDNRYRAERLVFKGENGEAFRIAALINPGYLAALKALNAALHEHGNAEALLNAVPYGEQRGAPFILAKTQILRRSGKLAEAAKLIRTAPRTQEQIVNSEQWWAELRFLTRKLLDAGLINDAYAVASHFRATQDASRVDAEFTAGWIALRYLKDGEAAEVHFARAANFARPPLSISRGNYWLARSRELQHRNAVPAYERAALYGTTYYGQLASAALGETKLNLRGLNATESERNAFEQRTGTQALRLLLDHNASELAQPLAIDYSQILGKSAELDALSQVLAEYRDPGILLRSAKAANLRGFPMDRHAFPVFGIPEFSPLPGSADKAMVFAIARQESAFDAKAVSSAGARGLMQMMPATAAATARKMSVPFALSALTAQPQLNAQLGAAHLGELMQGQRGSYILVFAAYNAGPGRVQEWIRAYGDPRNPDVDAIDWIERIPITETRNYVQRVMENMQVYRALFTQDHALLIHADMQRGIRPALAAAKSDPVTTGSIKPAVKPESN